MGNNFENVENNRKAADGSSDSAVGKMREETGERQVAGAAAYDAMKVALVKALGGPLDHTNENLMSQTHQPEEFAARTAALANQEPDRITDTIAKNTHVAAAVNDYLTAANAKLAVFKEAANMFQSRYV